MQHRQIITRSVGGVGHGRAPYRGRPARALLLPVLLLLSCLPAPLAEAATPKLRATGKARKFEVKAAGRKAVFRFRTVAGCRYRLTAVPGTLTRPILEIGRAGEEPFAREDAGASGESAVHVWDAERDAAWEVHVGGFSAQIGDGRVKLETLNARDEPVEAHRRFLWCAKERARVGELLLGETNRWELVVEEGGAYEIAPTRGSAGRVHLRVLGWDGEPLADSRDGGISWLAWPPVRFAVPQRVAPPPGPGPKKSPKKRRTPPAVVLEVRALLDGGGTYGVRMRTLGEGETVEAPEVKAPADVERGPVEGQPQTFRAGPGDLAVVYVPRSPNLTQIVEMLRGETWVRLEDMGLSGSARSQENALITWFRPYYPGTYRFRGTPGRPPTRPKMMLHDRAVLGSAPMHMGTGADPTVSARLDGKWKLVGLGICMPGWDYLFVCVDGPEQGIAMRARDAAGKTIRSRASNGQTISPGLGPSLRFRVPRPGVYRLEARGSRRLIIRPLMRRASN